MYPEEPVSIDRKFRKTTTIGAPLSCRKASIRDCCCYCEPLSQTWI